MDRVLDSKKMGYEWPKNACFACSVKVDVRSEGASLEGNFLTIYNVAAKERKTASRSLAASEKNGNGRARENTTSDPQHNF